MSKILLLDNYDSFTYNLYQLIQKVTDLEIDVIRNDKLEVEDVGKYDHIFLSPGPGIPEEAGLLKPIIAKYSGQIPIFGVCLGLQAIGEVFGSKLKNLDQVYHGIRSEFQVIDDADPIFKGIPSHFHAGRYHSWVIDRTTLTDQLTVTCTDKDNEIMAIAHKTHPTWAVQFHPESIMTEYGAEMVDNFLKQK